MLYELPTSMTDPVAWLQWINQITGYWFGPGVLIGFFLVMFLSFKRYDTEKAFATSSILTAVLSFFFMLLGIAGITHVFLASLGAMSSLFFLRTSRGSE